MEIYARKGNLYVDYRENGVRVRKSLKLKDTKANRNYAMREIIPNLEYKLAHKIPTLINLKLSDFVGKVIDECAKESTRLTYENSKKQIFSVLADKDITEYSTADFALCVDRLRAKGISVASIKTYFTPFKIAFNQALQREIILKNPLILPRIREAKKAEKSAYSLFEVVKILQKAKGELKTLLYFAFYTGARSGEILALTYGDIKNGKITINKNRQQCGLIDTPKNGKAREIFILKPLADFIATMDFKGDDEYIFSKTYTSYNQNFKALLDKLGYRVQGLHSTRHTFISLCVSAKVDLMLVQKMVGHSNLEMIYKVYSHYLDSEAKRGELDRVFDTDTKRTHNVS